jgi:DNA sulfur modification protein DndB
MGDWVYYLSTLTTEQVARRIELEHNIRERKELGDWLQRELKPRVKKIEHYLRTDHSRFFNALVVGVFGAIPEWFPLALREPGTREHVITAAEAEELAETLGVLRLTGSERMFAIDGQHRAEAVRLAIADGRAGMADGVTTDQIPVVLVAHVEDASGKRRSRKLFADINKRAVPVSKGDLAVIDEEDVHCIAARVLYATYKPLDGLVQLTERPETDVGESKYFTNLLTVVEVVKKLRHLYRKQPRTKAWDPVNVDSLVAISVRFFDFLLDSVPHLDACLRRGRPTISAMRRTRNHLFFRPVGLALAAEVYASAVQRGRVEDYTEWLRTADLKLNAELFHNVLWTGNKVTTKGRAVAVKLVQHKIGMLDAAEKSFLLEGYRKMIGNPKARLP